MESSGISDDPSSESATQRSPNDPGYGPRKYMSKSHRACDFCRSRKSACRSTENGLSCQLCSSHGRQCTFALGSIRRLNRNPKMVDRHQRGMDRNAIPMEHGSLVGHSTSQSTELEGVVTGDTLSSQIPNEWQSSFGIQGNLVGPSDRVLADLSAFPQQMFSLTEHENSTTGLPERRESTITLENPDFDIQPSSSSGYTLQPATDTANEQQVPHPYQIIGDSSQSNHTESPTNLMDHIFFDMQLVFPEDCEIDRTSENVVTQVMGPTCDQDPHLIRYHRYNTQNVFTYNRISYRNVADPDDSVQLEYTRVEASSIKADELPSSQILSEEKSKLEDMISHEAGERLIQLFYKFVNPNFPILSMTEIPSPSDSPLHLLAAIYLVAEQFASFDDFLCLHVVYHPTPVKSLFDLTWRLISTSMHRPAISIIQASLILLLKAPRDRHVLDRPFKWSLLGFIINAAQSIGLHLNPEAWRVPTYEIQSRKRLSWVIFAMDKWFSLSLGFPSNLSDENWTVFQIHTKTAVASSAEMENPFVIQFSKLTSILNSVLYKLFSIKSLKQLRNDYSEALRRGRSLLLKLSTWHSTLPVFPPSPKQHAGNTQDYFTDSSAASLELGYHTVQLIIFRALLRALGRECSTAQERGTTEWKESNEQCRAAAKSAIISCHDFTSSLGTHHFQSFWAPWTSHGFAMMCSLCMALIATSSSQEEAKEYKLLLDKVRSTLRMQSKSFDTMRFALLKIEAVLFRGFDAVFTSDLEMESEL